MFLFKQSFFYASNTLAFISYSQFWRIFNLFSNNSISYTAMFLSHDASPDSVHHTVLTDDVMYLLQLCIPALVASAKKYV